MAEAKKTTAKKQTMDAKAMLKSNAEARRKIHYRERKQLEVITDKGHYRKGQIINPHVVMAEQLIKDKIAVEVK